MKRVFLTYLLVIICTLQTKGQDTLYVLFEPHKENTSFFGPVGKHKDDPLKKKHYPFEGGGMYLFEKVNSPYSRTLTFSYKSYTPEWMDYQFDYKSVDIDSIRRKEEFKDIKWFNNTSYDDIIKTFKGNNNVIYLLDEQHIIEGRGVLVKVYFGYEVDE